MPSPSRGGICAIDCPESPLGCTDSQREGCRHRSMPPPEPWLQYPARYYQTKSMCGWTSPHFRLLSRCTRPIFLDGDGVECAARTLRCHSEVILWVSGCVPRCRYSACCAKAKTHRLIAVFRLLRTSWPSNVRVGPPVRSQRAIVTFSGGFSPLGRGLDAPGFDRVLSRFRVWRSDDFFIRSRPFLVPPPECWEPCLFWTHKSKRRDGVVPLRPVWAKRL